jgi:hypothetical protein
MSLFLAALFITQPATASAAAGAVLPLCQAKLARRVSGHISAISTDATSETGSWIVTRGTVTALLGMGEPGPGQASAHHLIRARYRYVCWVQRGKVRKTTLERFE